MLLSAKIDFSLRLSRLPPLAPSQLPATFFLRAVKAFSGRGQHGGDRGSGDLVVVLARSLRRGEGKAVLEFRAQRTKVHIGRKKIEMVGWLSLLYSSVVGLFVDGMTYGFLPQRGATTGGYHMTCHVIGTRKGPAVKDLRHRRSST
jgi:hypothetical protein